VATVIALQTNQTNEALKHRLAGKDDLLTEYRERLHIGNTDQTSYSKLSNRELYAKVIPFVKALREYHDKEVMEMLDQVERPDAQMEEMRSAKSEKEKTQIWRKWSQRLANAYHEKESEYKRRFATESILLRDELLSRLPMMPRDKTLEVNYEFPNSYWSSEYVASDLESLAKQLPNTN
jgi:hypothetical protein